MRRLTGFALSLLFVVFAGACKGTGSHTDTSAVAASGSPTPTPSGTPDPNARGDCRTGSITQHNKTKLECEGDAVAPKGGTWTQNKTTPTPKP